MQTSIETRWFLPGTTPPQVSQWFHSALAMTQPIRIDSYLYTPETTNLGVKFREGNIEIKQKIMDYGLHTFNPHLTGLVESWHKWSFPITNTDYDISPLTDMWIPVRKERVIRRHQITSQGGIRAIPGWLLPLQRSSLEITGITINNTFWWSLGFEIVGIDIDMVDILEKTVALACSKSGFPILSAEHSFSYPQWLNVQIPKLREGI